MTKDRSRGITRSKWFLPSFSFVIGLVILAVAWLGGQPGEGVVALVGLTVFGLFFLLAGRSETVRGLRGDGRDERFARIDLQADSGPGLRICAAWRCSARCCRSSGRPGWCRAG